jgi:hypothetical protein
MDGDLLLVWYSDAGLEPISIQQSGGLLIAAGWTAATPLFFCIAEKCKSRPAVLRKLNHKYAKAVVKPMTTALIV